jgi:RND family efflux transporter MFP subunit
MSAHADKTDGAPTTSTPPGDDLGFALPEPATISRARAVAFGAVAAALLGAAFLAAWLPKRHARAALETTTAEAAEQLARVEVVSPKLLESDRDLVLPGSVRPLEETVVYPRANGYVKRWLVDLGDHVDEGQLLAEIDTPEIAQQLAEARAELAKAEAGVIQSKANREYATATLRRYEQLVPSGVASQQELEQKKAAAAVDDASVHVSEATVGAQRANIARLSQLQSFAKVVAPFAGTVVSRSVERGALVTAGNATPLFSIAATDPVRVFVHVPQDVAPSVRAGAPAKVRLREYPGRAFEGTIARAAGALDPASRTMTTEVRVPNPKGELLTGMYAEVALTLSSPHRVLEVPATALLDDARGLRLAVVDEHGKVHLAEVVVERDTGATVQIASGLGEKDRVVKIASAALTEGQQVDVLH